MGGKDGAIHIWELPSLRQKSVLRGFVDQIRALAFSKDGSLLVGSSYDGRVRVWNLKPGKEPDPLPIECGKVIAFAISPTSPLLATSHSEEHSNQLRLWDLRTGQEKLRVPGCVLGNNTLAFSPDGGLLACGDKDNTIRLRHSGTGEVIATLDKDDGLGEDHRFLAGRPPLGLRWPGRLRAVPRCARSRRPGESQLDHEPPAGAAYQVVGPFDPLSYEAVYSEQEQFLTHKLITISHGHPDVRNSQTPGPHHASRSVHCHLQRRTLPDALKQAGPHLPSRR